jgi:hypothetical protein
MYKGIADEGHVEKETVKRGLSLRIPHEDVPRPAYAVKSQYVEAAASTVRHEGSSYMNIAHPALSIPQSPLAPAPFKTVQAIQERDASDIEILAANDIGNMIAHLPQEKCERALDAGQFMDDVCSTRY